MRRGDAYSAIDNFILAMSDYDKAAELDPTNPIIHANRSIVFIGIGDYAGAFAASNRAIEINSNYARGHACRGVAYDWLKDHESAIADYSRAIELDPNDQVSYSNRAIAYRKVGDLDRALTDCDHVLAFEASWTGPITFSTRPDMPLKPTTMWTNCFAMSAKSLNFDPSYVDAERTSAAKHSLQLADREEANTRLRRTFCQEDPNHVGAYVNRCVVNRTVGNATGGISDFRNSGRHRSEGPNRAPESLDSIRGPERLRDSRSAPYSPLR